MHSREHKKYIFILTDSVLIFAVRALRCILPLFICYRPFLTSRLFFIRPSASFAPHRSLPPDSPTTSRHDLHMSFCYVHLPVGSSQTDPANQNIDENNQIKLYVLKRKAEKKTHIEKKLLFSFMLIVVVSLALFLRWPLCFAVVLRMVLLLNPPSLSLSLILSRATFDCNFLWNYLLWAVLLQDESPYEMK